MNLNNDKKFTKSKNDFKIETSTKPKTSLIVSRKYNRDRYYFYYYVQGINYFLRSPIPGVLPNGKFGSTKKNMDIRGIYLWINFFPLIKILRGRLTDHLINHMIDHQRSTINSVVEVSFMLKSCLVRNLNRLWIDK